MILSLFWISLAPYCANRSPSGQQVKEFIGHNVRHLIPPASLDAFNSAFDQALETGDAQAGEMTIALPGGERLFLCRLQPVSELMNQGAVLLVASDIPDGTKTSSGI